MEGGREDMYMYNIIHVHVSVKKKEDWERAEEKNIIMCSSCAHFYTKFQGV